MDDNGIQWLLQFAPPPVRPQTVRPPNDEAWRKVETHFGFEFPPDYKRLIEHYGTGCWGGFIQIMNPFSNNRYNNQRLLLESSHLWCATEPDPHSSHPEFLRAWNLCRSTARARRAASPYDFYPARPGLFPWAQGPDEAVTLYWLVRGHPSTWRIVIERWSDGPTFDQHYEIGCAAFLLQWLQNAVCPAGFPKAAGSAKGWFDPWTLYDAALPVPP